MELLTTTTSSVQANVKAEEQDKMPDEVIIANMRFISRSNLWICSDGFSFASTIVLAGQGTSVGAMSRFLDLMALDPNLQTWLREEITEALAVCAWIIAYDFGTEPTCSVEKKRRSFRLLWTQCSPSPGCYLPRSITSICPCNLGSEAVRILLFFRWCCTECFARTMQDAVVPLQFPIKDAKAEGKISEIVIRKGTPVYIGLGATNRSTSLWGDDATEFKLERWMGRHTHGSTAEQIKTPGIFSNMYGLI